MNDFYDIHCFTTLEPTGNIGRIRVQFENLTKWELLEGLEAMKRCIAEQVPSGGYVSKTTLNWQRIYNIDRWEDEDDG